MWAKNHRTLVVFEVAAPPNYTFAERVCRLLQSLGGENIKVDLAAASDGVIRPLGIVPSPWLSVDQTIRLFQGDHPGGANIKEFAESMGYDMFIVVAEPSALNAISIEQQEELAEDLVTISKLLNTGDPK